MKKEKLDELVKKRMNKIIAEIPPELHYSNLITCPKCGEKILVGGDGTLLDIKRYMPWELKNIGGDKD